MLSPINLFSPDSPSIILFWFSIFSSSFLFSVIFLVNFQINEFLIIFNNYFYF